VPRTLTSIGIHGPIQRHRLSLLPVPETEQMLPAGRHIPMARSNQRAASRRNSVSTRLSPNRRCCRVRWRSSSPRSAKPVRPGEPYLHMKTG